MSWVELKFREEVLQNQFIAFDRLQEIPIMIEEHPCNPTFWVLFLGNFANLD
jgi:hypothetical protein